MRVIERALLVLALFAVAVTTGLTAQDHEHDDTASNVLYIATNDPAPGQNTILAYRRDPDTGCLTLFGTYPTGGTGFANPFGFLGPMGRER